MKRSLPNCKIHLCLITTGFLGFNFFGAKWKVLKSHKKARKYELKCLLAVLFRVVSLGGFLKGAFPQRLTELIRGISVGKLKLKAKKTGK